MANDILGRIKKAWNVFSKPENEYRFDPGGSSSYYRPDRPRLTRGNERSIATSIYNRIALDVCAIDIRHVRLDENGRFLKEIDSGLNNCLSLEANIDQSGRAFIQDVVLSMFDEGCVGILPIDTDLNPNGTGSYDILTMRTAKIVEWFPTSVRVRVYNDRTGNKEEIVVSKRNIAIIENPLFAVMNEPNSTLQRLIRKLALLDIVDEQASSGKLDLIIQLPYIVKTDAKKKQAEERRQLIEEQLSGSRYGIAYTDGTERITQLNRPLENNLVKQIEYLTQLFYSQLGITQEVMDGSADEKTMLNYYDRTVEPVVAAIADGIKRTFLTKTARSQGQSIEYFRDPFRLVPVSDLAEMADKFTRNEIMTSNEIRQIIGMKPSEDPNADELRNKNLNESKQNQNGVPSVPMTEEAYQNSMANLDDLDAQLMEIQDDISHSFEDESEDSLEHYASPYYDPVKAHEYYERTKELKGRRSTTGLNAEGRKVASYVKKQLNEERKTKVNESKAQRDSQIESLREETDSKIEDLRKETDAQSEAYRVQTQNKIDQLREKLEKMPSSIKKLSAERISSQISNLLEANQQERIRLENAYRESSASLRSEQQSSTESLRTKHTENTKKLKEEYDKKYEEELDKIKSDSKYRSR